MIGVQADSTSPLPNLYEGICVDKNVVSSTIGPANRIWHNEGYGVRISDSTDRQITITENSITKNGNGGIKLMYGANNAVLPPSITSESPIAGLAPPNCRIEIFSDSSDQGSAFLGWTQSDERGAWSWSGISTQLNITATATDVNGNTSAFSYSLSVSVEQDTRSVIPETCYLNQNYPNPFNPATTIEYGLLKAEHVSIKVFDLRGREIMTLVDEKQKIGHYTVTFDAFSLASGMYFYRIQTETFLKIRKMVLVK